MGLAERSGGAIADDATRWFASPQKDPPTGERPTAAAAFVLTFSTGARHRVGGAGLIGRNPVAEPGEYVDEFVRVSEPQRTVSRTHLEFGLDDGALFIVDRWSVNGTVVVEAGRPPRRIRPGHRIRLARGARVEFGDLAFTVD